MSPPIPKRASKPAPVPDTAAARASNVDIASWIITGALLLLVLWLRMLPALLAGLLVYELVQLLSPLLQRRLSSDRARLIAVLVLASLVVALLISAILGIAAFFRSDAGSLTALFQKMAEIIEGSRDALPPWVTEPLPADADELRDTLSQWLREHGPELRLAGTQAGRAFAHILIGMVIGAILSLRKAMPDRSPRPLAGALIERGARLGNAFRRIVFAQIRISAINTVFTGLYLAMVLPLLGIHLPFTKTLIAVTFIAGLLPIIGNLISNTVIVIVSLAHSVHVAAGSLVFLIVIHKLEYFLNARIVGTRIHAAVWEILVAMLMMETAFGLPGVVAAPIYYAYLKQELVDRGLV